MRAKKAGHIRKINPAVIFEGRKLSVYLEAGCTCGFSSSAAVLF